MSLALAPPVPHSRWSPSRAWRILGEAAWLTPRDDAWRSTWELSAFLRGGLELLCVCRFLLVVAGWFIDAVNPDVLCWRCHTCAGGSESPSDLSSSASISSTRINPERVFHICLLAALSSSCPSLACTCLRVGFSRAAHRSECVHLLLMAAASLSFRQPDFKLNVPCFS